MRLGGQQPGDAPHAGRAVPRHVEGLLVPSAAAASEQLVPLGVQGDGGDGRGGVGGNGGVGCGGGDV